MLWHELALKTARRRWQLVCRCSMNECRVGAIFYQSKTKKKNLFRPSSLIWTIDVTSLSLAQWAKKGKIGGWFSMFFSYFSLQREHFLQSPQKEIHFSLFLIAIFSYFRTQCLAWWDLKTKMNANLSFTIIISSYSRSFYSLY